MNIKEFEYRFNLASTHTAKDIKEWCDILSDNLNVPIKKENTISLYDFVNSFNKIYKYFKRDLAMLPKYDFGKSISLMRYGEKNEDTNNKEFLMLYIDEPNKSIVNDTGTQLLVWVKDNEYESYVTNDLGLLTKKHYFKRVYIDKNVMRKYLDFFKKYNSFIEVFERIHSSAIFSNGTSVIFFKIEGDIMKKLNKITLEFGNYFLSDSEDFEIPILLGDNIAIDYNNSKIRCHELEEKNKAEIIDYLLKNIYVHRNDLSTVYEKKEENKVLELVK